MNDHQTNPQPLYAVQELRSILQETVAKDLQLENLTLNAVEAPSNTGFDYGINLSKVAGQVGLKSVDVSVQIAESLTAKKIQLIKESKAMGPFINFNLNMFVFGNRVVGQILEMGPDYGIENEGRDQKVVIDMSSPNIAKRMSYGHLRSTIIGDALANIHRAAGYEVIRDNHIGDWGTQFGKLIVAIKKWGNEKELLSSADPIGILQDLYVKFHSEVEVEKKIKVEEAKQLIAEKGEIAVPGLAEAIEATSQELIKRKKLSRQSLDINKVRDEALDRIIESLLEKQGRSWFLKLETGDPEARRLWRLCIDLSLREFNQIYEILGISFEESLGESYYENMLSSVVEKVRASAAGKISDGALVIDMQDKGLGVAIVQKSDGASVYLTRDLACAMYRQDEMKADKAIYVVGEDQKLYFQQLFEALRKLGYSIGDKAEHVYFGMVKLPEGKMSTRKGRVILLKDVINEGFRKAQEILQEKNPELLKNSALADTVIRQIAVGALKWNDLSQDARRPIVFDWDKALNFEGYSAPYVQYAAVRAKSILELAKRREDLQNFEVETTENDYTDPAEGVLIRQLAEFPNAVKDALGTSSPTKIAIYVFELAKRFNSFYTKTPVLKVEDRNIVATRLRLVEASFQVITNSLSLLGIEIPEIM